jgi:DMSO/TMAO reductase YedYZ molybdopterin-dependent catalytic subunit
MNGGPLPPAHGFPARLLVPGRYGMKNAKWIVKLSAVTQPVLDWYGQRNWNREAIIRTMSRIDTPARGATLPAGPQRIAGIAYAGDRGIASVEFSADGGTTWQPASFVEPQPDRDTWVRWQGSFTLAAGQTAQLVSRAIDGTGALQPEPFVWPQPEGGSGWDNIGVQGA